MFASVPADCDIYLISRVINICDDAQAVAVLKNCRAAMASDPKVIMVERVLPEVAEPRPSMIQSKMMSDSNHARENGRPRAHRY